ncbi:MAG TPA: galactose-1-phosphate uridylyltransferase [Desulfobacteraceae bacterium]|nr:galactose-1-phosphate uridylyltransferase [Desulfobacteraceae bacterium]HPJ67297.1 galactose-1-phosphate uridylyltransferase [Desulfobacteraceae bacterium]HPQ29266.1 galactose-1-phosphate uridylyltransferase [Desulfobacteraceae bacterium]
MSLVFEKQLIKAGYISPDSTLKEQEIEVRINPISLRQSRISFSRQQQHEPGIESLPDPPPDAGLTETCPFCRPQIFEKTPRLIPKISDGGYLHNGESILFPNMFPYGSYSAVSVFDDRHYVEIGDADVNTYADCFSNCSEYLKRIRSLDPSVVYMAITQNFLPSSGGSLLHPHLQIQADRVASNNHQYLIKRAEEYYKTTGSYIFSSYLEHERQDKTRFIGNTGPWEWVASFAPEGFYEIWGILPGITSFQQLTGEDWLNLSRGVLNTQRFYRSLNRNSYNLGILSYETEESALEMRVILLARSNYAPWTRNDHTGFEIALGDMTTFVAPEETAELARPFWDGH